MSQKKSYRLSRWFSLNSSAQDHSLLAALDGRWQKKSYFRRGSLDDCEVLPASSDTWVDKYGRSNKGEVITEAIFIPNAPRFWGLLSSQVFWVSNSHIFFVTIRDENNCCKNQPSEIFLLQILKNFRIVSIHSFSAALNIVKLLFGGGILNNNLDFPKNLKVLKECSKCFLRYFESLLLTYL